MIILARIVEKGKALCTTRGLCECVANSFTRAVLNAAMATIGIPVNFGTIVLRSEKSSSFFFLIYPYKLTAWVEYSCKRLAERLA